jgi:hypothetical protein
MVVASQLSQEGLELVRNKRDLNWLEKGDWEFSSTTGSRLDIVQDGTYALDRSGAVNAAPNGINDSGTLLYLDAGGFYSHSVTASPTVFSRLITVNPISPSASTTVTCLVQWRRGTNSYNFSAQTVLYDWR